MSSLESDFLAGLSVRAANFKCFGPEPQGFDSIQRFNIVIGRNNSGKSTLLDLLQYLQEPDPSKQTLWHKGVAPAITTKGIPKGAWRNHLSTHPHLNTLQDWPKTLDSSVTLSLAVHAGTYHQSITSLTRLRSDAEQFIGQLLREQYSRFMISRLAADRDMKPEPRSFPSHQQTITHDPDGSGATTLLSRLLTIDDNNLNRLVRRDLLEDLNRIYQPDVTFDEILTRQKESVTEKEVWEISLAQDRAIIPLSMMGSGVKTILLTLMLLRIYPGFRGRSLQSFRLPTDDQWRRFIFGLEELENNLHPAIQKRLFRYLIDFGREKGCHFVITTHSHVVIDLFHNEPDAQILHVFSDKGTTKVETVTSHGNKSRVFQDLGVRASDLLQANCVIWVEGPSDRIYVRRWIELVDPKLQEHVDFEFVFTGGSLLNNYQFTEESFTRFVNGLRINRHSIIVIDRDRNEEEKLKPWVERIKAEFEALEGMCWITHYKEIENYIPSELLKDLITTEPKPEPPKDQKVFDYLKTNGCEKNWENDKHGFATTIAPRITKDHVESDPDLHESVKRVCGLIRKWNDLKEDVTPA